MKACEKDYIASATLSDYVIERARCEGIKISLPSTKKSRFINIFFEAVEDALIHGFAVRFGKIGRLEPVKKAETFPYSEEGNWLVGPHRGAIKANEKTRVVRIPDMTTIQFVISKSFKVQLNPDIYDENQNVKKEIIKSHFCEKKGSKGGAP